VAPPENSVTNSRADCALTQQMIRCIKAISPCVKSASAKLFPDLHTVCCPRRVARSARWGQPHRSSALDGAAAVLTAARTRGVAVRPSWSRFFLSPGNQAPTNFANPGKLYPHFWKPRYSFWPTSRSNFEVYSKLIQILNIYLIYIYINAHCHWRCQPCLIRRYTMVLHGLFSNTL
jgi:hypothetical protein